TRGCRAAWAVLLLPCCWPAIGRVRATVRSIQLNALPGAGGQGCAAACCLGAAARAGGQHLARPCA
ncbi:hypothetical protein, partial [Paenacidovorax caeni]|uniref:hypothetical protein n=1 Tax=Paenacidovorax caeni TaxID=343013 RepID=UPI001F2B45FF